MRRINQIYYQTGLVAYLFLIFAFGYVCGSRKNVQDELIISDSVKMLTLGVLSSLLLILISSKIYYWNGSYGCLPQAMLSLGDAQQKYIQNRITNNSSLLRESIDVISPTLSITRFA